MDRVEFILDFWFKGVTDQTKIVKKNPPFNKWYRSNPAFDAQITDLFKQDLESAEKDSDDCRATPKESLARVLLFDQFSRNIFRNTPQAFAYDQRAVQCSMTVINEAKDQRLPLIQRVFLYMPLSHAEDSELQSLSVEMFQSLLDESKSICDFNSFYYESQLDHAIRYQKIIRQFGRFPHRNAVLNRVSTSQEKIFLNQ